MGSASSANIVSASRSSGSESDPGTDTDHSACETESARSWAQPKAKKLKLCRRCDCSSSESPTLPLSALLDG